MKRLLLVFIGSFIVFSCKTADENKSDKECTAQAIDSINWRMEELAMQRDRLLKTTSADNPVLKNMEESYLELLVKREEIQICLANKKSKSEE